MKKTISILSFSLILFLIGCNTTVKTNLRAYITNMSAKSTEVTFKVEVRDPDGELDSNEFKVVLSHEDDIKEEETTLSKGQLKTFTFQDLKRDTKYEIEVFGTKDEKLVSLTISSNKTFETLKQGDVKEDPLILTTTEEFLAMNAKKHYKLGADLDFLDESFTPLFTSGTPFTGSFDGDDHTIKNIQMTSSKDVNKPYLSIFGYASNSTIKNTNFDNIHINNDENSYTGIHYVGLIVSKVSNNNFELTNITIKNSSLTIKHNINNITTNRNLYVGLLGGSVQGKIANIDIIDSELKVTQLGLNGRYAGTDIATTGTYVGGAVGLVESDKGFGISKISVIDTEVEVIINQDKPGKGSGDLYVGGVFGANRSDRKFSEVISNTKITITHTNDEETEEEKLDNIFIGGISATIKPNSENLYYYGEIKVDLTTKIKNVYASLITPITNKSSTYVLASGNITINTLDEDNKTSTTLGVYYYRNNEKWTSYDENVKVYNNPTITVDESPFDLSSYEVVTDISDYIQSEYLLSFID
ncbi:MAG: hypothetical protein WC907_02315 [Acholeplasmataceae bacterium]